MATRGWARQRVRMPHTARSKYGAVKTVVEGITFDSKAEGRRYMELKLRLKAGVIRNLRLQTPFVLSAIRSDGEIVKLGEYRSDFDYEEPIPFGGWAWIVEDVKGFKTALYRWKKRHVESQYGIQISEIR